MIQTTFPKLPGLTWNIKKVPMWATIKQKSVVPGKEIRLGLADQPQHKLELSYNYLKDDEADETGATEVQKILGFFNQCKGSLESFWLNPTDLSKKDEDSIVLGALIGTGDGAETKFQISRNYGGFLEDCYDPQNVVVYVGGAEVDPADYTITNGKITFNVAPAADAEIAVDFIFFYRVRFEEDFIEVNNFLFKLYDLQQVTLVTLKP